jgi:hypothetical protein
LKAINELKSDYNLLRDENIMLKLLDIYCWH